MRDAESPRFGNHGKPSVIYTTAQAPWGKGETFVLTEALEMARYCDLKIVPLRPGNLIPHDEGAEVSSRAMCVPLLGAHTILALLHLMVMSPRRLLGIVFTFYRHSRSLNILLKNLSVLPKVAWLTLHLRHECASHIHCHWASTSATFAYGVSLLTSVPWSLTAHRWDIEEDNMLAEKVRTAAFVRVISERGRQEVLKRIPSMLGTKVVVIPMGVRIPEIVLAVGSRNSERPVIACVANLSEVKGHRTLLEACKILGARGVCFDCRIVGQGPLRAELEAIARVLNLHDCVQFAGLLSHSKVLRLLEEGRVQVYVQPSIRTMDGQEEGIPVSLMEALACGIPVVATQTGAIAELVSDGRSGILVPAGDPEALARAIESLLKNPSRCAELGRNGREIVREKFNIVTNSARLREAMGML